MPVATVWMTASMSRFSQKIPGHERPAPTLLAECSSATEAGGDGEPGPLSHGSMAEAQGHRDGAMPQARWSYPSPGVPFIPGGLSKL